jgi:hypothetical protein
LRCRKRSAWASTNRRGGVQLPGEDDLADALHEPPVPRLALPEIVYGSLALVLRASTLRDVDGEDEDALRHGLDAQVEPTPRTVREGELVLEAAGHPLPHAKPQRTEQLGAVDAGIGLHHRAAEERLLGEPPLPGRDVVEIEIAPVVADELAPRGGSPASS